MEFKTVDEILDFAIKKEEQAHDMYNDLSERVDKSWVKELLKDFAQEELGHKKKLLDIKNGKYLEPSKEKILDLKIAEYVRDVKPDKSIDYQEALMIAMKEEKAAFRLYTDLAESIDDEKLKNTFLTLAQEEAKHKLRFELEYDEHVLTEN